MVAADHRCTTNLPQFVTEAVRAFGRASESLADERSKVDRLDMMAARAALEAAIERYAQEATAEMEVEIENQFDRIKELESQLAEEQSK
jgi:hypothetical protein